MSLEDDDADALMERVLEIALASREGWRRVLPQLTIERPDLRAVELIAAVARAGLAIEEASDGAEEDGSAPRLHRLTSLLVLDAWALRERGWSDVRARDLATRRRGEGAVS